MAKTVDTQAVREHLGDFLNQAHYRGEEFLVQRRGKILAAIVPYQAYEQLQRQRNKAFQVFHEVWDANAQTEPTRVAEDVSKAVREVRSARRRTSQRT